MRAVWVSAILFVIMIGLIGWNGVYVRDSAEQIRGLASSLNDSSSRRDTLSRLDDLWKSRQKIIALSVGYEQLDGVTEVIDGLWWAYSVSDEAEFERYRILLTDAVDEIERAERLCVESLF